MTWLLRSPFAGLMDGSVTLTTVREGEIERQALSSRAQAD
jgi:hypothetical protein